MYKDIIEKLKKNLSKKRFEHCLRVAETAENLAKQYNADPKKAYLAGLLHDSARDLAENELIKYIADKKLKAKEYELQYPVLLHGEVAADMASKVYGVTDPEVILAIKIHTAGGREMSPLSKVVYIADFIEPGRKGDQTNVIRATAQENLDKAVYEKAQFMLEFSKRIKEKVHPDVLATVEYYKHA